MGNRTTLEFRQEVVRVALTSGLTQKQVTSDFKIGFSTLCRWIREERDNFIQDEPQIDLHGGQAGILHFAREDQFNQKYSVKTERKLITELSEAEHIVSTYTNEGFIGVQPSKTEMVAGASNFHNLRQKFKQLQNHLNCWYLANA